MTDKEQIMIDGVNVSGCKFFEPKAQVMQCHRGALTQRCKANNCYFKQLKRKEQECEKYKQTLDESELLITNHMSSCEKCPDNKNGYCLGIDNCSSRCLKKILDIINKAKDGKNEKIHL